MVGFFNGAPTHLEVQGTYDWRQNSSCNPLIIPLIRVRQVLLSSSYVELADLEVPRASYHRICGLNDVTSDSGQVRPLGLLWR